MIISVYHLLKHFISNHFIKESRGEKQRYRRYVKIQLTLFTFQQSFFLCKKCFLTSHSIRRDYRFLLWSPANLINTWDNPPSCPCSCTKLNSRCIGIPLSQLPANCPQQVPYEPTEWKRSPYNRYVPKIV